MSFLAIVHHLVLLFAGQSPCQRVNTLKRLETATVPCDIVSKKSAGSICLRNI